MGSMEMYIIVIEITANTENNNLSFQEILKYSLYELFPLLYYLLPDILTGSAGGTTALKLILKPLFKTGGAVNGISETTDSY
jgi:hypothetical protein